MRFSLLIGSLLLATATGCAVETVATNPAPEPAAPEQPGEPDPNEPSNPTKPTNPATPAAPPTVKLDAAFTTITDASNKVYSATPGPNNTTYVALRKAGGSIGWGTGTILRRYLANGTLDTSFATQGELTLLLVANPEALAVDAQGRILIGGTGLYDPDTTSDTGREIVVVRVTAAGVVDTSYSGGRTKLSFSPANVWTTGLRVRADGGAFVSVYGRTNGNDTYGSFLIGSTGAPVSGFGTSGFASSPFPTDGGLAVENDVLVPTTGGLVRYGSDGKSKGAAIEDGVIAAKPIKDGFIAVTVTAEEKLVLSRFVTGASTKKDKTYVGPTLSESFGDFEVLKDGSVIYADGGSLSWVGPKGGAATVVVKDAGASKLAQTADGKLMVMTSGDNAKVQRYTY